MMRARFLAACVAGAILALPAVLYAIGDSGSSRRGQMRRASFVTGDVADAGPNPDASADASADASCCDASLEGYLSVEAVGFEAVGY